MGESILPLPERVDPPPEEAFIARAIGLDVAGVLRYQIAVLDREDRLESGTGVWRTSFMSDRATRTDAVRESVLRTLQMALNGSYFPLLQALAREGHLRTGDLAERSGLGRLTLQERVADLVSAGLATKVPEADQVAITGAGAAVVDLVNKAVGVAASDVGEAT
ncbi:marR family protein [bacterium BMS3Bbin02]|nr:marR family protein [bacterium BMS3Bbin02]